MAAFAENSIDLLHIDGLHTYEAVRPDYESWLPKLAEDGIVLLHDTEIKIADFGVWKLWGELSERHPARNFQHLPPVSAFWLPKAFPLRPSLCLPNGRR
ncbi:class I SAM-dependent methyltransferase [Paenibacillus sp. D51F]